MKVESNHQKNQTSIEQQWENACQLQEANLKLTFSKRETQSASVTKLSRSLSYNIHYLSLSISCDNFKTYQRVSCIACLVGLMLLLHLTHHDLVAVFVLVHLLLLHHHLLLLHHVGLLFGVHLLMFVVLLLIHLF